MSNPGSKISDLSTPEGKTRKQAERWIVQRASQDEDFRRRLIDNPSATVSQELKLKLPANFSIQIVEEAENGVCIVLPSRSKSGSPELTDNELEMVAGGKGGTTPRTGTLGGDDSHTQTLTSSGEIAVDH